MSNFFGALESDDEEPVKVMSNKNAAPADAANGKGSGDRLTGAEKKNRDQKRHGASRGGKAEATTTKKHGGFDRKSGTGR